jgi:hypothetical protein
LLANPDVPLSLSTAALWGLTLLVYEALSN